MHAVGEGRTVFRCRIIRVNRRWQVAPEPEGARKSEQQQCEPKGREQGRQHNEGLHAPVLLRCPDGQQAVFENAGLVDRPGRQDQQHTKGCQKHKGLRQGYDEIDVQF